tara:strand:+ start:11361 stop:11762 length:402 start_codon:yes stop_codon:yes gene_type:complete
MPTEILSGLWIGSLNDVYNSEFYNDNNINIAINCTCDQGFLNKDNINKIRIPLSNTNNSIYELTGKIDKILNFIHKSLEEKNIFIYCYNGITVSPLIVGLYMIKYGNISKDIIREILRSKNPNICLDCDLGMF